MRFSNLSLSVSRWYLSYIYEFISNRSSISVWMNLWVTRSSFENLSPSFMNLSSVSIISCFFILKFFASERSERFGLVLGSGDLVNF